MPIFSRVRGGSSIGFFFAFFLFSPASLLLGQSAPHAVLELVDQLPRQIRLSGHSNRSQRDFRRQECLAGVLPLARPRFFLFLFFFRRRRRREQKRFRAPSQVNDFSMRRRVGRRDVISLLRAERRSHLLLLLLLRVCDETCFDCYG
jgi:hypothetical protein